MSKLGSSESKNTLYCSFCGKSQHEVRGRHRKRDMGKLAGRMGKITKKLAISMDAGGEGGIRTPDTVARIPHFECGAIDHSATSPRSQGKPGRWAAMYPTPPDETRAGRQSRSMS